jgi:hypothetical protein
MRQVTLGPRKLTADQRALMAEIVSARAPHLLELVDRISAGGTTKKAEAEELSDVLTSAFLDELDDDLEPSRQGKAIDDLIGLSWEYWEGFFSDAEGDA